MSSSDTFSWLSIIPGVDLHRLPNRPVEKKTSRYYVYFDGIIRGGFIRNFEGWG